MGNISKWDTNEVNYMNFVFSQCSNLSALPDISKWKTDNLMSINGIFYGCSFLFSLPDISKWKLNDRIISSPMYNEIISSNNNSLSLDKNDIKSKNMSKESYFSQEEEKKDYNIIKNEINEITQNESENNNDYYEIFIIFNLIVNHLEIFNY